MQYAIKILHFKKYHQLRLVKVRDTEAHRSRKRGDSGIFLKIMRHAQLLLYALLAPSVDTRNRACEPTTQNPPRRFHWAIGCSTLAAHENVWRDMRCCMKRAGIL